LTAPRRSHSRRVSSLLRVRGYYLTHVMDVLDAPLIVGGSQVRVLPAHPAGQEVRAVLLPNGVLRVEGLREGAHRAVVYDARGAVRCAVMLRPDGTTPGLTRLPPGQYVVRIHDAHGHLRCQARVRSPAD
jgi:hypothetical protein